MSQFAVTSYKAQASGASTVTVVGSAGATIYNILVYPVSGGPSASSSGGTIMVLDSVSGASASGAGSLVWSYGFGAQSGFGTSAAAPGTGAKLDIPMTSGIVVTSVAGWVTEIIYSR